MKLTVQRLLRLLGTVLGIMIFLVLIPAGAMLILAMFSQNADMTEPLGIRLVCLTAVLVLQAADIALLVLFLTVGRRKGLLPSCAFMFGGVLLNTAFSGICILFRDDSGELLVAYCLLTGMLFLFSALTLSAGSDTAKK